MANKKHLAVLEQGVEVWNQWRKDKPEIKPDLSGVNLIGKNLTRANFRNVDIRSTQFNKAILKSANFYHAKTGLKPCRLIASFVFSLQLSSLAGAIAGATSYQASVIFVNTNENSLVELFSFISIIIFFIATIRAGIKIGFLTIFFITLISLFLNRTNYTEFIGTIFVIIGGITVACIFAIAVALAINLGKLIGLVITLLLAIFFAYASFKNLIKYFVISEMFVSASLEILNNFTIFVIWVYVVIIIVLSAYLGRISLIKEKQQHSWIRQLVIDGMAIFGTNFYGANLDDADFRETTLAFTDFKDASIIHTNFYQAKGLNQAKVEHTILVNPDVRDLVVTHRATTTSYAGCNLRGANLASEDVDLTNIDLTEADIRDATFEGVCLQRANLTEVKAAGTNFKGATLTGACIKNWGIDSTTNLDNVICEYVYLDENKKKRNPPSGTLAPGELALIYQKVDDIIPLLFREGINWRAFVYSFEKIKSENEEAQLKVVNIGIKKEGFLLIEVKSSPDVDKGKVSDDFWQGYQFASQKLEPQYQARLDDKDKVINDNNKIINNLFSSYNELQTSYKQLQEEFIKMAKQSKANQYISGSSFYAPVAVNVEGDQKNKVKVIEQKETLTEAAKEIEEMLAQQQNKGMSVEKAQQQVANELVTQAQNNPTVLGKLVKWVQSLGDTAAKTTVSEATKGVLILAWKLLNIELPSNK